MVKESVWAATEKKERSLRHGGREVLHITWKEFTGEFCAARHVHALCEALCEFAERELFPRAAAELERCVREGRGYAFTAYDFRISLATVAKRHRAAIELTATYLHGREVLFHRTLSMLWSADGEIQHKR